MLFFLLACVSAPDVSIDIDIDTDLGAVSADTAADTAPQGCATVYNWLDSGTLPFALDAYGCGDIVEATCTEGLTMTYDAEELLVARPVHVTAEGSPGTCTLVVLDTLGAETVSFTVELSG